MPNRFLKLLCCPFFLNTIFVSRLVYPENPKGTQVIAGSLNTGYGIYTLYTTMSTWTQTRNLFRPKCMPIALGNSDGCPRLGDFNNCFPVCDACYLKSGRVFVVISFCCYPSLESFSETIKRLDAVVASCQRIFQSREILSTT